MAIDTKAKRHSALGQRFARLPFGRRFTQPPPDGTIDQADRQTAGFAYGGISTTQAARVFYRPHSTDAADVLSLSVEEQDRLSAAVEELDRFFFSGDEQVQ